MQAVTTLSPLFRLSLHFLLCLMMALPPPLGAVAGAGAGLVLARATGMLETGGVLTVLSGVHLAASLARFLAIATALFAEMRLSWLG